ncbi:enoyl-CoA hydratase/isomerase family protein [Aciditerrimonas ferrireducens]|uniref:Enoyl-CoA hydratase/isomerase family protein n=1 Tax=Aciditerrimonas ferrireducens TaxID=667306 RepID=A0ABV6C1S5_9ACTN
MQNPVLVERSAGVVTVTLNRPERKNAANAATWQALWETLVEVRRRAEDRVVVLTGAGGDFCSGADLADGAGLSGNPDDHRLRGMLFLGEVVQALHDLPQPTIAKIRGVAAGAGLSLALGCDLTVVARSARLTTIFAKRGLSLDAGASWLLPRLVGLHRAKELAFFGGMLSAEDAKRLGLVNRVVEDDQLDAVVADWAAELAAGPPLALAMTKRLLDHGSRSSLAEALDAEAFAQSVNFSTADTAEALQAFLEKRTPRFQGR